MQADPVDNSVQCGEALRGDHLDGPDDGSPGG